MEKGTITLAAVGDVLVDRDKPESIFSLVGPTIRQADIAFCQSETAYSDKGSMGSSGPRGANAHDVRNYPAIPSAGFGVVSMASNHTGDWGRDALLDCIARLRRDGIASIGAGADIDEAREPAIVERNGTRIAFLAYCSVAPKSYYAAPGKAGVAPMRAITHYEPLEDDQPGTPCEIMTYPHQADLEDLLADIRKARRKADIVAVSLHWGVHFVRALIADYQPVVAHAAVDAGADIILGHHPHILKGVEIYKGKVILYSMGNFAFDIRPRPLDTAWNERRKRVYRELYRVPEPDPDSAYHFQADSRYSMIAKIAIGDKRIGRVSFTPVLINKQAQPEPVLPLDPKGQEVLQYLSDITQEANLNATYTVDGGEVVIGS